MQDFLDFVSSDEQYVVFTQKKIAQGVALGVKYLCENDIIHRDSKPALLQQGASKMRGPGMVLWLTLVKADHHAADNTNNVDRG